MTASQSKMLTISVPLKKGARFHARPAGAVAKLAQSFDCMIMLQTVHGFADAHDFLSVMRLTPRAADKVDVITDGPGEEEAGNAMKDLILDLMEDMASGI